LRCKWHIDYSIPILPFIVFSSRNPLHLACQYFQILKKIYFDSSSIYSSFIVINIRKFVDCKVFSMHFNFSQWSITLIWRCKKKYCAQHLNIWVFVVLSSILVLNPKITKDFPMKMCIYWCSFPLLTLLFLLVFWIVVKKIICFVVSCFFCYSKYSLWCCSHYISTSTTRNPIHSNPCIATCVKSTIFVTMDAICPLWHLVKLTCSRIND